MPLRHCLAGRHVHRRAIVQQRVHGIHITLRCARTTDDLQKVPIKIQAKYIKSLRFMREGTPKFQCSDCFLVPARGLC